MIRLLSIFIFGIIVFAQNYSKAQEKCNCPKNGYTHKLSPDTIIDFSNNRKFSICGYKQFLNNQIFYREFELTVCGEDTFVKYWHALQLCKVEFANDTLFIREVKNLPIDSGDSLYYSIWITDKYYFKNDKLFHFIRLNRDIPKYDSSQIKTVLKEYEGLTKGIDDKKIILLRKLFVATISGSQTARKYFLGYEKKVGKLDGIYAEDYDDLKRMLISWEKKSL
jgi:hypothetical protein